jgi:hypothetical protein
LGGAAQLLSLGSMRLFFTLAIFLGMLSQCSATTQSDADIASALVGTWMPPLSEQTTMHGKATYYRDGHGIELLWPVGQPESTAVRIETRWSVTNRVLIVACVKSSDPGRVPVGVELKDRILSVTADEYVFEPESGYGDMEKKRHTRIRTKNGA